jgi:hypothetical protein
MHFKPTNNRRGHTMSKLVNGADLPENLKREVLRSYVFRPTFENGYPKKNPANACVVPISDAQWLKEHAFYVTKLGTLDKRIKRCEPHYLAHPDNQ